MTAREHTVEETEDALDADVARTLQSELRHAVPPHADTLPGAPARPRAAAMADDEGFRALATFVQQQRAALKDKAWDNLAHVEAFARALRFCVSGAAFDAPFSPPSNGPSSGLASGAPAGTATAQADRPPSTPPTGASTSMPPVSLVPTAATPSSLLARLQDDIERRRIGELLWSLLPTPARARASAALPDALALRADTGFPLEPGDLPRIAESLSAHLADERLLDRALAVGARVLAPRALCPYAARGQALWLVIDEVVGDTIRGRAQRADGTLVDVRRSADGAPIKTVDGQEQRIEVKRDALAAMLLNAGPDARGLDLRFSDDRCLLLSYAALLRARGAFQALERADALSHAARLQLVRDCTRAAFDAVALFTLDPIACAITLARHERDLGWPERAWSMLEATGAVRDALPREPRADFARAALWLDAVVPPGFGAGRLSAVAAGRAFARLVTSVLAPLGVLPCSGLKDGSGAVLLQTLAAAPPDAPDAPALIAVELATFGATPTLEPLEAAWESGRGLALPEPRGQPQHDLAAMPSFLAFFLEAADPRPDSDVPWSEP